MEKFETRPTLSATASERYAHCPAGAYQAVEQTERGKQQHSFAENRVAAAFGITRRTEPCRLGGDDLADAVWAGNSALDALMELGASKVMIEHKPDRNTKADIMACTTDGLVIIELKFTGNQRSSLDPQMLVTAAAAWRGRTDDQTVVRIITVNGKARTADMETIPAPAMTWITDHLVASWISDACAESPVEVCPTWCVGCRRRTTCTAYQSLRNQIVKDEVASLHHEILAVVRDAVESVTATEMMNDSTQEPIVIRDDTIDAVEERELAEMGSPVHRVWRDGISY